MPRRIRIPQRIILAICHAKGQFQEQCSTVPIPLSHCRSQAQRVIILPRISILRDKPPGRAVIVPRVNVIQPGFKIVLMSMRFQQSKPVLRGEASPHSIISASCRLIDLVAKIIFPTDRNLSTENIIPDNLCMSATYSHPSMIYNILSPS